MKIIDVSRELFSTPAYEDDPHAEIKKIKSISDGYEYNLSKITFCPHNSTHIDAPLHFFENGSDVYDICLEKCFGACRVVEERFVSLSDAEKLCKNVKRLIFKGNVDISLPAAQVLSEQLELVGTEGQSIGNSAVHKAFLRTGVVVIENLDLSQVKVGDYVIMSLPLKMRNAEASPCRTLLIEN